MPTLEELQEMIRISVDPDVTAADNFFDNEIETATNQDKAKEHYKTLLFYTERIKELAGETRSIDYGQTSPNALVEYIHDRAKVATGIIEALLIDFTNPGDEAQSIPLYYFETSGSGSASASGSSSGSGG